MSDAQIRNAVLVLADAVERLVIASGARDIRTTIGNIKRATNPLREDNPYVVLIRSENGYMCCGDPSDCQRDCWMRR